MIHPWPTATIPYKIKGWQAVTRLISRHKNTARRAHGGKLPVRAELKESKSSVFLLGAMKDPQGANLDRIQVVKGWLGEDSESLHEKIHDVDWAGGRTPDEQGCYRRAGL